jgi:hypothetical protein
MITATLPDALSRAAEELTGKGLPASYSATPGHALDVCLGSSARGRRTHCVFQVLDPGLGLYLCYDRDESGRPLDDHRLPRVTPALDRTITYVLMPVLNTVLNPFDPAGRGRSVVVGCWHGRPTPTDLLLIPVTATRLLRTFAGDGQLAVIWTDSRRRSPGWSPAWPGCSPETAGCTCCPAPEGRRRRRSRSAMATAATCGSPISPTRWRRASESPGDTC